MANHQINITKNGTTTLATAGKYCDRNVDVNVSVPSLDTTDATATAKNIDYEQTAYVNGEKITGTKLVINTVLLTLKGVFCTCHMQMPVVAIFYALSLE